MTTKATNPDPLQLPIDGYNHKDGHTLATAIVTALAPLASTCADAADELAIDALRTLAEDLDIFWFAVDASTAGVAATVLSDRAIVEAIYRFARRAETAADLAQRIRSANVPAALATKEAAE